MITFRVPSACSWRRASSQPPVSACRLSMVAAADRDVPGGICSGANSQSATASMRPIVPARRPAVTSSSPSRWTRRCRAPPRAARWGPSDRGTREDDVTEPGYPSDVPDADRAEQEALLHPPAVGLAGDARAPAEDVPEADALEQQLAARPG